MLMKNSIFGRGHLQWPLFEWMHVNCFPDLIQFSCLLPPKEDNLRNRTTKVRSLSIFVVFLFSHCVHQRSLSKKKSHLVIFSDPDTGGCRSCWLYLNFLAILI